MTQTLEHCQIYSMCCICRCILENCTWFAVCQEASSLGEDILDYHKQSDIEEKELLFKIVQAQWPYSKSQRNAKKDVWRDFVYSCWLEQPAVHWVFGAKRIGKSTLLRKNTFDLQQQFHDPEIPNIAEYPWAREKDHQNLMCFMLIWKNIVLKLLQTNIFLNWKQKLNKIRGMETCHLLLLVASQSMGQV